MQAAIVLTMAGFMEKAKGFFVDLATSFGLVLVLLAVVIAFTALHRFRQTRARKKTAEALRKNPDNIKIKLYHWVPRHLTPFSMAVASCVSFTVQFMAILAEMSRRGYVSFEEGRTVLCYLDGCPEDTNLTLFRETCAILDHCREAWEKAGHEDLYEFTDKKGAVWKSVPLEAIETTFFGDAALVKEFFDRYTEAVKTIHQRFLLRGGKHTSFDGDCAYLKNAAELLEETCTYAELLEGLDGSANDVLLYHRFLNAGPQLDFQKEWAAGKRNPEDPFDSFRGACATAAVEMHKANKTEAKPKKKGILGI